MAEAVLEKAEDAVADAILDRPCERLPELAVDRSSSCFVVLEQKGKVDEPKLGYPVGEIARRLVAERKQSMLHEPQNVLGAVAEVHDVPDVLDVDAIAELGREPVADELQRTAESGRRGAVAAHADLDCHADLPYLSRAGQSDFRQARCGEDSQGVAHAQSFAA